VRVSTHLRSASLLLAIIASACAPTVSTPRVTPDVKPTAISPAAPADPVARAIVAVMAAVYPPDTPGAAIVVVKDGRVLLRKAYGMANLELRVPMQPEHVFALASLSKQFTAAAILKLAEEGRLSVDDDITKFLPTYPTHGARITIEHLLTHTSGLSGLSETSDLRAVATQESPLIDVLGDWVKDLPPDSAPGERWAYSNWGYGLLGSIVEQASGMSYAAYVEQRLLAPAGMTHTFYGDRRRVVPMRAPGYELQGDQVVNIPQMRSRIFLPGGAASLLSTVDDLARWDDALKAGRMLTPASLDRMFASYRLKDGTPTNYGYGWDLGSYAGHRVQEHAGGTTGFLSYLVRMPDDGVFVAILSNRSFATPPLQATAHRIAAIAIGAPIVEPPAVALTEAELDRIVGTYRGSDVGTFTVTREGASAYAQVGGLGRLPLIPTGPLAFRTSTVLWTWTFELGSDGRAARARVREWKIDDLAARVEPVTPVPRPIVALDAARLDACAGEYESLNGILVKVTRAGDHLVVTPLAQAGVEIYPVSATEFVTKDGGVQYTFVTGDDGRVTRYLRSTGGGRPVPARRIY
jgi:CubicO group peptidase (beta-lactamase class C family)